MLYIGAATAKSNAVATNPYLKLFDDNTLRSQFRISGAGSTTVKSDASGNVTIESVNTNTTYSNFTRTVAGLVPAPGAATTTRYLREDGTWVIPPNTADTH